MPTKSYIRRYLAAKTDHSHRYHVVRSSFDQSRRVPFGKWTARIKDKLDVLLDFSSPEPIRIFMANHSPANVVGFYGNYDRHGWYFVDGRGRKVPCCSGYEPLFVAYLKWNDMPFEYQKWEIGHAPTRYKKRMHGEEFWKKFMQSDLDYRTFIKRHGVRHNGFSCVFDFYLPAADEFVELKGWPPHLTQAEALRYLKRKGYCIRVLKWEQLRQLLGISVSYATCLNRARKDFSQPSRAFADPRWIKERLSGAQATCRLG